ncbi:MAG: hypothetical protein OHK0046_17940 [Anaerolineae bacterium]
MEQGKQMKVMASAQPTITNMALEFSIPAVAEFMVQQLCHDADLCRMSRLS